MRVRTIVGALALLGISAVAPLPAQADTAQTLYLHSLVASTAPEQVLEVGAVGTGPSMDESVPTRPDPKIAAPGPGNPDYRKNVLLNYWTAPLHANVTSASAHVWVTAPAATNLTVELFSGPQLGVSSPFATTKVDIAAGGPTELDIPIETNNFAVLRTLVMQLVSDGAVGVLYDSLTFPSSVTVALAPYEAAPPTSWAPSSGFGAVSVVSSTMTQRETSLVIDPTDENRMFICDPSGVPNYPYGQSYFHTTSDAGATWRSVYVETSPTDTRRATFEGGDCDVAYDAGGTMYSADTWLGSLSVGASSDHGDTWSGTALAATAPVVDRPWLVGGPTGTVHVIWQDLQAAMPTAIWYSRSTDFAHTFLPAVPVVLANADEPLSWEGNLVVAPSGNDMWIAYTRRHESGVGGADESVWVASSHDGGTTWSSQLITTTPTSASHLYPSIALDGVGGLHVVFASATDTAQPVWYTASADGGAHWSAPVKLLDGISGFAPWVAAGPTGEVAVEWLGTYDTTEPLLMQPHDWYVFWARISGDGVTTGTTTSTPIFSGVQSETPEFNQVRLDSAGHMRIGSSVNLTGPEGTGWAILYQSES